MISVLLADDHPLFREGLRFTLERADDVNVVAEAYDGVEAVEHARRSEPDVVVMDLAMPRLDGIAATQQLSGERSRVLVLTMSEDDGNVFAAMRAGAAGYLVKGAAAGEVVAAVRAVAAGHVVLGPGSRSGPSTSSLGAHPRPGFPNSHRANARFSSMSRPGCPTRRSRSGW